MKRILSILAAPVVILFFLPMNLKAQEATEKKIKIIVDDGSGKKVIVDTVITDNSDIETIKTADGKIIWIGSDGQDQMKKDSKHVTVTVNSDGDSHTSEGNSSVAVWTEKGESSDMDKVIVIKEVKGADTHLEKNYDVIVASDDASVEKARYVIAKDGMVVTVEGDDEEKTRELMKTIEVHMGVKDNGVEKEGKSETKKSSKK